MPSFPRAQRLRAIIRNHLGRRMIHNIPEANLYARGYATYHEPTLALNADLNEGAEALMGRVDELVRRKEHFYDLVVLDKQAPRVRVRDRRGDEHDLLDLVTNSYNDLEHFPETREQLVELVRTIPLSSCISRKIAGTHGTHAALEAEVADFMGYETCVLGTCGYITQISTVFALFKKGDVIFSDQHNHSSIVDGCRLSGAKIIVYPHRDYDALDRLMHAHRKRFNAACVVSDGVFSTKGATANLDRIVAAAKRNKAVSIIDDTHGITVVGRGGRGCIDLYDARPDVITGGFGKAFGAFGGFTVASRGLAEAISLLGRQNVNTSHMSPVMAGQALINLRHYRAHQDEIQGQLMKTIRAFNAALAPHGIQAYPEPDRYIHPIFCFFKRSERETLDCFNRLVDEGFLPSFFPPPVAPWPSLRFSFHRLVSEEEAVRLAGLLGTMGLTTDPGDQG
jgi:8-amino-7-oxononanoate synthase